MSSGTPSPASRAPRRSPTPHIWRAIFDFPCVWPVVPPSASDAPPAASMGRDEWVETDDLERLVSVLVEVVEHWNSREER